MRPQRQIIKATRSVGALDSKYAYEPEKLDLDVAEKLRVKEQKKEQITSFLLSHFDNKLQHDTIYDVILDSVVEVREKLGLGR